jgi:hypothetical protein
VVMACAPFGSTLDEEGKLTLKPFYFATLVPASHQNILVPVL